MNFIKREGFALFFYWLQEFLHPRAAASHRGGQPKILVEKPTGATYCYRALPAGKISHFIIENHGFVWYNPKRFIFEQTGRKEGAAVASEKKKEDQEEKQLTWQQTIVLYLHDWAYLLMMILIVFLLVFRVIVVSGSSMFSTLWDGDYLLLLSNTFYHEPEHGDVVVISKETFDNGSPIVKRVIATEGQTVDIDFENGIVYVDDVALKEDYINNLTLNEEGMYFPLTVADDCIFVLGDNRLVSRDSRDPSIGQVHEREVLGKALFLMVPGTSKGELPRDWSRIGVIK